MNVTIKSAYLYIKFIYNIYLEVVLYKNVIIIIFMDVFYHNMF